MYMPFVLKACAQAKYLVKRVVPESGTESSTLIFSFVLKARRPNKIPTRPEQKTKCIFSIHFLHQCKRVAKTERLDRLIILK